MKKVFTFSFLLLFSIILFAQDTKKDMKNFRFGGTVSPSLDWYKPDNLKKYANDGSVFRFGVLINGEYSFSGNFAIGFGLGLGSAGGKVNFTGSSTQDTVHYYSNDDKGILTLADTNGLKGKFDHFRLISRTYNGSYYLIPLSLKMRTNEIGFLRYFFEPRLNVGIRKKVRSNDKVANLKSGQTTTQKALDITKDMSLLRLSVTLSAGGEYYVSGSTALTFSIGYDYGLSNVVQSSSDFLLKTPYASSSGTPKAIDQKFDQSGIVLSFGVLF
jgi:Outer membrane protein beta-barrel domain